MDDKTQLPKTPNSVGAYEAKSKFSELIARAEKGETFVVTKNGRPVARITPMVAFDRERAQRAAQRIRDLAAQQGPPVSAEEAQRNWEDHKADMDREWDARVDRWLKS
jgi:prevent-host-death family protein